MTKRVTTTMVAPAPWRLTGQGLVLLYAYPKWFIRQYGDLAPYQRQGYRARIGAVMLINYHTSGVGPYQELLFIPGVFKIQGKFACSISKIYVSTQESVFNGRLNWGIPKHLAQFNSCKSSNETTAMEVANYGAKILSATWKPWGPAVPVNTKLFPWFCLIQEHRGQFLQTKPQMKGHVQLAKLQDLQANPVFFPPIQKIKPFLALSIKKFEMVFPEAESLNIR